MATTILEAAGGPTPATTRRRALILDDRPPELLPSSPVLSLDFTAATAHAHRTPAHLTCAEQPPPSPLPLQSLSELTVHSPQSPQRVRRKLAGGGGGGGRPPHPPPPYPQIGRASGRDRAEISVAA
eukprot:RCo013571